MTEEPKHVLFITGAAGYIGGMLCDQFSQRPEVLKIIALDKEPKPELLKNNNKIVWLQANTSEPAMWREQVIKAQPDIIIHTAWQIRDLYGKKATQWRWNVEGSRAVFDLAFSCPSVKKLIHFSTASSYGAYPTNTLERRFTEEDALRSEVYQYALEKKQVEEILQVTYKRGTDQGSRPTVFIVRPAAITGPRGRYMFQRFGLMATLRNRLPKSTIYKLIGLLVNRIPIASDTWCRQLVHEDDVCDIVDLLAFKSPAEGQYEIFNLAPPGAPVLASDMAEIVGKKTWRITPSIVRAAFFLFWHGTRGVVATSPGGWRYYTYPIVMDGSKITKKYNYQYRMGSREALAKNSGRYEKYVSLEA